LDKSGTFGGKIAMKGHVRERGKGNWYAVLDVRDPATGKRRRKWHSLQGKGKREAQIECADLISRLAHGAYLEPDKTTLAEFLDRWLEHTKANVAPRTHERYAEIAKKNIAPLLGNAILAKLKPAQLSEAYATRYRKVGATAKADCRREPCCTCTGY
jgi:Phage integrase, N-terminal SAM-like domain